MRKTLSTLLSMVLLIGLFSAHSLSASEFEQAMCKQTPQQDTLGFTSYRTVKTRICPGFTMPGTYSVCPQTCTSVSIDDPDLNLVGNYCQTQETASASQVEESVQRCKNVQLPTACSQGLTGNQDQDNQTAQACAQACARAQCGVTKDMVGTTIQCVSALPNNCLQRRNGCPQNADPSVIQYVTTIITGVSSSNLGAHEVAPNNVCTGGDPAQTGQARDCTPEDGDDKGKIDPQTVNLGMAQWIGGGSGSDGVSHGIDAQEEVAFMQEMIAYFSGKLHSDEASTDLRTQTWYRIGRFLASAEFLRAAVFQARLNGITQMYIDPQTNQRVGVEQIPVSVDISSINDGGTSKHLVSLMKEDAQELSDTLLPAFQKVPDPDGFVSVPTLSKIIGQMNTILGQVSSYEGVKSITPQTAASNPFLCANQLFGQISSNKQALVGDLMSIALTMGHSDTGNYQRFTQVVFSQAVLAMITTITTQ